MPKALYRIGFLLLAALSLAPALPPGKTSVAIYPIKAAGATDKSVASALSALLSSELTPSTKLYVIEEAMLKTVMERAGQNASDACDDTSCQVEIGKLVKAQKMITGDVVKLGSLFILSLKVVDIQSGTMEFTTKDQCACADEQLPNLVAVAAAKIRNYFGENVPVPSLPQGVSPAGGQAPPQGAQAFVPAQPTAPTLKTFQEFHPPGTKGGSMVFVSDFKFYIDKFEVTNQDYQECVAAGACKAPPFFQGVAAPQEPIVDLYQNDVQAYCQWVGKRMPTNAEWESSKSIVYFLTFDSAEKQKSEELQKDQERLDGLKKEYDDKSSVWSEDTKLQKANNLDLFARSFVRKKANYKDQMLKRYNELLSSGPVSSFGFRCARDGS